MSPEALYAPWPAGARRTDPWGALGLVLLSYLISSIPVVVGTAVFVAVAAASSPDGVQQALADNTLTVTMPLLLGQFLVWGGLVWLWVALFERRGPATLGLGGGVVRRYLIGLAGGVALLVLIGLAGVGLNLGFGVAPEPPAGDALDLSRLAAPGVVAGLGFVALIFLIQGGMEEVVFRGWLMSALAARWGGRMAVSVSSLAFAVFHAHVFVSGLWFGVVALTGLGLTGLVFALAGLLQRSIWEIVAAHGAFNAAAVIGPVAAMLVSEPELDLQTAFAEVFTSATGMAGADAVTVEPATYAQTIACGAVCLGLLVMLVWRFNPARPLFEARAEQA